MKYLQEYTLIEMNYGVPKLNAFYSFVLIFATKLVNIRIAYHMFNKKRQNCIF